LPSRSGRIEIFLAALASSSMNVSTTDPLYDVHRSAEADRDAGVRERVVDVNVENAVRHFHAALHSFPVRPVPSRCQGIPAPHDGRRHDPVGPRHRLAARVEAGLQPVQARGAILRVRMSSSRDQITFTGVAVALDSRALPG